MSRSILGFLIKVFSLTALFTSIMVALFGISNKRFESNSHLEKDLQGTNSKRDSSTSSEGPRNDGQSPTSNGKTIKRQATQAFQQDLNNLIAPEHRDAYVDALKTKNRCSLDQDTCEKLIRAGDYSVTQQLRYQTLTLGVINTLDALLSKGNTSKSCLNRLKLYKDDVASRGSATHSTIKMNTNPLNSYREYFFVLTHELGHIVDLCGLEGYSKKKHSLFTEFGEKVFGLDDPSFDFYSISRESERVRKKGSSAKDFISGYAAKNLFEDFAESQNSYLNHPSKFRELANKNPALQRKYDYFEKLYGSNTFAIQEYPESIKNSNKRVWDTTRWEE